MMRLAHKIAVAALLFAGSAVPAWSQDKKGMEKIERHKDLAGLMSTLHNWGVDRQVEIKLGEAHPRILSDLEFAGPDGGVLVVARFEHKFVDSGEYRNLISNQLDYVGIGPSAVDAEIANIGNPHKPFYKMQDGYLLDYENSTAYWFRKSGGGTVSVQEKPLDLLHREVINQIVARKMEHFDWKAARSAELTRLSKIMTAKVSQDKVDATIEPLLKSRDDALARQQEINAELRKQLDRARKAQDMETTVKALDFLQFFVSTMNELAVSSSPGGRAMTKEETLSHLDAIENDARSRSEQLQLQLDAFEQQIQQLDQNVEKLLRSNSVPTNNLPPAFAPEVELFHGK
ncbi:MAG: hypothetical protein EOR01_23055 [Mesorhizobium sp.]|uniref:hypothetical protein n=1 Tax=Mesorhizobium sp. TaxID=1871066 RepID=UPI000FE96489|nr:hypothetical protein [Mesorhizobium sp.]RWP18503.1 MAG: hypothetical protein EOR01_23055 [Mesorhizobium sp.]